VGSASDEKDDDGDFDDDNSYDDDTVDANVQEPTRSLPD
jgi:hypothetical protein